MKPFTVEDLLLHQEITSLHCAYELNLAACAVESIDRDNDTTTSSIWLVPLDSGEPIRMTTAGTTDTLPQWSPNGEQLGFVSDRAGANQVFVIPRGGGEARRLGSLDGVVLSFKWSPAGDRLLAICSVKVDPDLRGARPAPDQPAPPDEGPQVIWKLPYKVDGMGYSLGHEAHLFCIDVASGTATRLTDGPFNVSNADWSPDGQHIAYVRSREGDESIAPTSGECGQTARSNGRCPGIRRLCSPPYGRRTDAGSYSPARWPPGMPKQHYG